MTSPRAILEGKEHRTCAGCRGWHGPVTEQLRCLEAAIERERNHPDRIRGRAAREACEEFERFGGRR